MILRTVLVAIFLSNTIFAQTKSFGIDGVYELVSETTKLSKPKAVEVFRKPPDWSGLFFFTKGFFSVSWMETTRNTDWISSFPQTTNELGYEAFAGKYEFDGQSLTLVPDLKLHPFADRLTRWFEAKFEGNTLILSEKIRPYTEDLREGARTIVLKRVAR
jgi:hypothetical protein